MQALWRLLLRCRAWLVWLFPLFTAVVASVFTTKFPYERLAPWSRTARVSRPLSCPHRAGPGRPLSQCGLQSARCSALRTQHAWAPPKGLRGC